MKKIRRKISEFSKRFQFTQGMAFGLTISSFLAYGVVNITSFSPGTTISSSAVNANFQQLKVEVEKLQVKKTGSLATPFNISCVSTPSYPYMPSYPGEYVDIQWELEDGVTGQTSSNVATITVPETGIYQIMYYLPEVASFPIYKTLNVNGTPFPLVASNPDGSILKKLNGNDTIQLEASCSDSYGTDVNLPQDAMIVIKKL